MNRRRRRITPAQFDRAALARELNGGGLCPQLVYDGVPIELIDLAAVAPGVAPPI